MNVVCLLGRFTGEPELRRTQNDVAYEVVVDNAYFAESKREGSGAPAANPFGSPMPAYNNDSQPAFSTASAGDFEEIVGDDELPF